MTRVKDCGSLVGLRRVEGYDWSNFGVDDCQSVGIVFVDWGVLSTGDSFTWEGCIRDDWVFYGAIGFDEGCVYGYAGEATSTLRFGIGIIDDYGTGMAAPETSAISFTSSTFP